jgi:hypothetical protein
MILFDNILLIILIKINFIFFIYTFNIDLDDTLVIDKLNYIK